MPRSFRHPAAFDADGDMHGPGGSGEFRPGRGKEEEKKFVKPFRQMFCYTRSGRELSTASGARARRLVSRVCRETGRHVRQRLANAFRRRLIDMAFFS